MLITFVALYLVVSIAIGLIAATRVHSARDYISAGRNLPLYIVTAMVFATWFGAETVLGISATFLKEGMRGLVSDPIGASLCLILFGLLFARPLYRLNLLTIGDYYRMRYGRAVELITAVCIVISYLGWVSAQITALGLVFNLLSQGAMSAGAGMVVGAGVVLTYTLFGGMWSVAITTFVQMIVIVLGLFYIMTVAGDMAGGFANVVQHAAEAGKFAVLPEEISWVSMVGFVAALITMGFGSIPQQDVFQRANTSRHERVAVWGSVLGGIAYFLFAFVPLMLAYSATLIDPAAVERLAEADPQHILPRLILDHMSPLAQVVFFGALLSVIMSTASGTLLAPSVIFSENIVRRMMRDVTDDQLLRMTRIAVFAFTVLVTVYALTTDESIHKMVENAYKVTLVAAFVPLAAGLYWRRASNQGAILAALAGLTAWIACEIMAPDGDIPPQFAGFLASVAGMLAGSLLPQRIAPPAAQAHDRA
jgi:Na+/proline symporter